MGKQFTRLSLFMIFIICVSILMSVVNPVQAQDSDPTSTPFGSLLATPQPTVFASDLNIVTFDMLRQDEFTLLGPYDSNSFSFVLPANWKILPGAQLNLSFGVSFNTISQNQGENFTESGGTLTVFFNNNLLAVLPLNEVGEIERSIQIPVDAFASTRSDDRMVLSFDLANPLACYDNYNNGNVSVYIHSKSYFTMPHESIQPDTSLVNFPRPIFQDSIDVDAALLVIPDEPTTAELQAALIVGAGLGNLTNNKLLLDLTTPGNLTPEQAASAHLVYVGNTASLPILKELNLPQPVIDNEFQIPEGSPDDGVVQMINSPWSDAHVILIVSGNTGQGTIKAAQAIGSGIFLTNRFSNLAVIQQVENTPVSPVQPTDQTLADLGYPGRVFENWGVSSTSYSFYVPPGWTLASDANFEMAYGHSALLDYDLSGISVLVNGSPIGSVRLSDSTADQAINQAQVVMPASAIVPGYNRLDVKVNIMPIDYCVSRSLRGLWIRLWPESTLHLPLIPASANLVSNIDLAAYPAPFVYDPMLENTSFVLAKDDLESWRAALQIAAYLGYRAGGASFAPSVFYGDDIPAPERSKHNLLVIGIPSQLPIMSEINNVLPASFSGVSDIAAIENKFQITYRIPTDSPLGYVELLSSPWNPDNMVLAVLGNQTQGVSWAASSLIDPDLRSQLAGNFAVINDRQIITTDTRLAQTILIPATQEPGVDVVLPNGDYTPTITQRPNWILPAFIMSIVLVVLVLVVVALRSWSRNRTRRKRDKES